MAIDSLEKPKNLNKQAFTNLIERHWLMKQYRNTKTAFIAISKDVERFFFHNLDKKLRSNVFLLHNGIDIKRFRNNLDRKIELEEKIRIVSVGNLVPKKNHRFLIDIAVALKEQNRDFSIDILGYGPLQEELENYVRINNISDFIHFRGNVKNVEDYLKKANVYVHPANYEPLGLVLIEAMASGLPVICLDGRGNRDLMIHGKNGYIFQEENSEQFVETIIELFDDQKKYLEISSFSKEFSSQFDIKNYVEKLVDLYESKCSTSNNSILKNAS